MEKDCKIVWFSLAGGLLLWVLDAAIDSFVFSQGTFTDSLLFDLSWREVYFRSFMVLALVVSAFITRHMIKKQRQIEERYRNLVELSSDIIYVSNREGKQMFMNDAAYRILERSPEEVIGRPMINLIHPDDREKTLQKRREIAELNTDAFNFENRYVTRSGRAIPVLHNVRVLKNQRGEFIGTQGIARDITERKLAEDELKRAIGRTEEEKARSEAILAAIGDGISIQDRNFRVMYQNRVHQEMVGGLRTGELCYKVYSHGDSICPGCPVMESFNDGKIHTLEKQFTHSEKIRTLEIKASPLRDSSGKIVAGIEAVRDITDRKIVEERLSLFSEVVEEAGDGVQIVDLSGLIVYSNKAIKEIYGFSPEEFNGQHVNAMNADPDFAGRVILPKIKETGRWSGELTVKHKDGRTFPVWLSTSLVKDARGNPIAMVGIIRDITERKRSEEILNRHRGELVKLVEERTKELSDTNEKLRKEMIERERMEEDLLKAQKLESLGILAGGIAHDFNNLLAAILGNISLAMLDLDRNHASFKQLLSAEKASLRAQDLTQQLLTFSKGGSPVKKTITLVELIKEAATFALRGSRVKYQFAFPEDLRPVDADEGQISQVIHNLVINADHAMPEGGIIEIECANVFVRPDRVLPLREGDYVRVSVKDHGVGIPREYLGKIFDPYFTTKQKGSGLGLATTYSIIRKHGGHISVESKLASGTTFHVYLPASREQTVTSKPEKSDVRTGAGRILIMDDEAEVRETTGNILTRLGYQIAYAVDGKEAIEMYQQSKQSEKRYDLVIMDLTVPGGVGGKEAVKKLHEIDPAAKAIVSSGYSNDPIMADFRKYGFAGVVIKPYRLRELSEEVYRVLNGKKAGRSDPDIKS